MTRKEKCRHTPLIILQLSYRAPQRTGTVDDKEGETQAYTTVHSTTDLPYSTSQGKLPQPTGRTGPGLFQIQSVPYSGLELWSRWQVHCVGSCTDNAEDGQQCLF